MSRLPFVLQDFKNHNDNLYDRAKWCIRHEGLSTISNEEIMLCVPAKYVHSYMDDDIMFVYYWSGEINRLAHYCHWAINKGFKRVVWNRTKNDNRPYRIYTFEHLLKKI